MMEGAKILSEDLARLMNLLVHGEELWSNYAIVPLDLQTVVAMAGISRQSVKEMHDRIIFATAQRWNAAIVTSDGDAPNVPGLNVVW